MSDGGFHEAQINNMEMAPVSKIVKNSLVFLWWKCEVRSLFVFEKTWYGYEKYLAFHF